MLLVPGNVKLSSFSMPCAPSSWNTCVVPGQPAKARTYTRTMTSERLNTVDSQGQQPV